MTRMRAHWWIFRNPGDAVVLLGSRISQSKAIESVLLQGRVSFQGVKSLGGHLACLCRGFEFYEVKKNVIIFEKENGNTFTLLIIFIVESLQKEQNSTCLLL